MLNSDLNSVTIQLGEITSVLTTFDTNFSSLVKYIQESIPQVKILITRSF